MSFLRPELAAALGRGREVLAALVPVALGLWLIWLGGYLLVPLGLAVAGLGLGWALLALRRLRFAQDVAAPGLVEVDEAQIGYLGPDLGGFVALPDLVELRLIVLRGRRLWRLKQADGQALLVPVDASGADRLFDAFTSLPGMETEALVAALEAPLPGTAAAPGLPAPAENGIGRVIWRRPPATAGLDLAAPARHL